MSTDKHYNAAIFARLQQFATQSDWLGLTEYLDTLSHAHRRTAGYLLGERILETLDEAGAWSLARQLTAHDAKAYLVTMMKSMAERIRNNEIRLRSNASRAFMAQVKGNAIDCQKVATQLLPILESPDDIEWLFKNLDIEDGKERLALLLRVPTEAASFALLRTLRYVEHDRPLLVRTAYFLIQRGDGLGFNMASLIRTYYGLDEVKGTFSLHIQPYKFARIESSFEAFRETIKL